MNHVEGADPTERLKLFNEKATELLAYSFVEKSQESKFSFQFSPSSMKVERFGADKEATSAFILTFRFFVQEKEKISVKQMFALYKQLPLDEEEKAKIGLQEREYAEFLAAQISPRLEGITNRQVMDIFLYGSYAHANEDKRILFEEWKSNPLKFTIFEFAFHQVLIQCMHFIDWMKYVNTITLERMEGKV